MIGTTNSVISVAYSRPTTTTAAMPRSIDAPTASLTTSGIIANDVASAVIRIGRRRVRPVAISASRFSSPPRRSWFT